jgi:hypothetical protein
MTGYEAFSLYHVLKLHFTSEYDYFKYNGKSNITIDSFEKRKDKFHFYKLSRKYDTEEYKDFIVANMLKSDKTWAGSLLEEDAAIVHVKRIALIQALGYNFKNDCALIAERGSINELLHTDGDYPELLTMALQGEINIETVCILNSFMNFMSMWQRKIIEDIRYPNLHRKWIKYTPFIMFDRTKFREIALKELQ